MKTSEFRKYLKSKWAFTEDEKGFDWKTVEPCPTKGNRFFYAEAIDE